MIMSVIRKRSISILFIIIWIGLSISAVRAQNNDDVRCRGPIYASREVTRRAKIITAASLNIPKAAAGQTVHGQVAVNAILCRDGHVTDIEVVKATPPGLAERAIEAVRRVRFTPAELGWHSVSQRMQFQFSVNDIGAFTEVDPAKAVGRQVEQIDVIGNRRISHQQIYGWIKTRPGERYSPDQVNHDLRSILATGYFDALKTRVTIGDGVRGGVAISFNVVELPVIREVDFEGVKAADRTMFLDELLREHIDFRKGAIFDSAKIQMAKAVIKRSLESRGWLDVRVEVRAEHVSATEVAITFEISANRIHLRLDHN
jgi:TonB family protein